MPGRGRTDPRFWPFAGPNVEPCNIGALSPVTTRTRQAGEPLAAIEFENVRVQYRTRQGPVEALAGLDLSVPEGGVFGFLGANGAGKTTAIRALVGLLRGAQGRMHMLGADIP